MNGVIYCLHSTTHPNRTYIGATKNLSRRLRQHNGEVNTRTSSSGMKGGAKYTRIGRPWVIAWYLTGSPSWKTTLSCEWYIKFYSRRSKGTSQDKRTKARQKVIERFEADGVFLHIIE
jgi:predicted GIY-YIG superfamily endonuclease